MQDGDWYLYSIRDGELQILAHLESVSRLDMMIYRTEAMFLNASVKKEPWPVFVVWHDKPPRAFRIVEWPREGWALPPSNSDLVECPWKPEAVDERGYAEWEARLRGQILMDPGKDESKPRRIDDEQELDDFL